jgi:signal transduction histidine kinase
MSADWTTSPNARRVLQHADDARPAWLWSQDGQRLIWSNQSATMFLARLKKSGLKLAPLAVPLKGQVGRTIRLGSSGRTSLARIQFTVGEKPASATCATTPLNLEGDDVALLIVGVDPIPADIQAAFAAMQDEPEDDAPPAPTTETEDANAPAPLTLEESEADAETLGGQAETVLEAETDADVEAEGQTDDVEIEADAEVMADASPESPEPAVEPASEAENAHAAQEDVRSPEEAQSADDHYARDLDHWRDADPEHTGTPTASEHVFGEPSPEHWDEAAPVAPVAPISDASTDDERPLFRSLSALVDRLAADVELYSPLDEGDDTPPTQVGVEAKATGMELERTTLFQVTGRGFYAAHEARTGDSDALFPEGSVELNESGEIEGASQDLVEKVSRYNFDELSRILNDRVGLGDKPPHEPEATNTSLTPIRPEGERAGSLVNLGGETLVLNRLPLGILVFRDQQILFANRAITEMVGYESVEALRKAGLEAVFPAGDDEKGAGPVNHLVQKDGTLVPVTARLQSTSWQGRPALMLSASTTEVRTSHEDAVRAFASALADLRGDGFIEASRAGIIRTASASAATALGNGSSILGKTIGELSSADESFALKSFLERPARFAETERPTITVRSLDNKSEVTLFAQGQAGLISGYFGLVRQRNMAPRRASAALEADPALLARIGRGVRRPLNAIIGFSELIRAKAFGELGDERYETYAEDISAAGQEIAALVDELEDYARLREGRYLAERASLDLTELLETCVLRIRNQANNSRIIVRNAISETLPRVTADQASLTQAVLNLLASAIDQSPVGSTVIISAQHMEDGGIAIHVRDSSNHAVDMAERFVVFRDGKSRTGQALTPVRSSVGLALTRSLLAVNTVSLSVDPAGENGVLFTLRIPADLVETRVGD